MGKIKKQIGRFIISGLCAFTTDMIFYYILSNFIDVSIAKGTSYLIGISVAYLMNKYYTFEQKEKNIREVINFFTLYIISLCANVATNKICLIIVPGIFKYISILDSYQIIKLFSFLTATGVSTIINFIGMKFWVFKNKTVGE